jgi:hypothetical protein
MLAVACAGGPADGDEPVTVHDSAGLWIAENDLSRLDATCHVAPEPEITIGTAEGDEETILYRVFGATRLSDGRIVLVNQGTQEVRWYDADGAFLMAAGRAGEGPGEFRNAFQIWPMPGDTVWVGDFRPWRFQVFGPDGQWVRTQTLRPEYVNADVYGVLDDGTVLIARRDFPIQDQPVGRFSPLVRTVVAHDLDGELLDTIGSWEDGRWGRLSDDPGAVGLYPHFDAFAEIDGGGSRVLTGHESEPELVIFEMGREVRRVGAVRWKPTAVRTVTTAAIEAERQNVLERYETRDLDPAMRALLIDPLVADDRPVAEELPAFRSALLGRDGRMWVRQFQSPLEEGPAPWVVFGPEGRFACTAVVPHELDVTEFGEDYLLAEVRDDLGVERIVLHRIGAPATPE